MIFAPFGWLLNFDFAEIDNSNTELAHGLILGLDSGFLIEFLKIILLFYPIVTFLIQKLKNMQ